MPKEGNDMSNAEDELKAALAELDKANAELAEAEAELERLQRGEPASKPAKQTRAASGKKTKKTAKPKRARRRSCHGYWPLTSTIPPESSLVKVLPANMPIRDSAPVVTMHLDPMDRPVCKSCEGTR
jgi:hypothetical protein